MYEKFVVPVKGAPKIPAPLASARVVVPVVTLIADSAATATERVVVPVAANWANTGVEKAATAEITMSEFFRILDVKMSSVFLMGVFHWRNQVALMVN